MSKRLSTCKYDPQLFEENNSSEDEFGLYRVDTHFSDPIIVAVSLNRQKLDMEMDTGAAYSVISEVTKHNVEGILNVKVQCGSQTKKL